MPSSVNIGDTIRVKVAFRSWDVELGDYGPPAEVDNNEVFVTVSLNGSEILGFAGMAIRSPALPEEPADPEEPLEDPEDVQFYYYDFTTQEAGTYNLEFVAYINGAQSTITEQVIVGQVVLHDLTLMEDQEFVFMSDFQPLLVDPEEVHRLFPEASLLEVAEYIYKYSVEVQRILGTLENLPFIAYEYIQASVLCMLGKVYDFDFGGDGLSYSLGDLSVSRQTYGSQSGSGQNPASWCELAAMLKEQLMRGEAGMKAVVTGTKYPNPMPQRHIKSQHKTAARKPRGF